MIVKNGYSISFGDSRRGVHLSNTSRGNTLNSPKKKKTINNQSSSSSSSSSSAPPEPDNSDITCLNLTAGLYKKKYEGYFYDNDDFFNSRLVSTISNGLDIGQSYQILDIGTTTQQDWYNWGFVESPQYSTPEALGLPFPSIGKGVSFFGGAPIENAGTANLGPVLVSESVSSQIDDSYSQAQGQNNKSLIIKGYFKAPVNGVYRFRLISDDASYLWFGNNSFDGNRNINNAVVAVPGIHAPYPVEGSFTMTEDSYYPLTVEFGNGPDGEGVLIFEYMPPGSDTWTSDLSGKLFYDVESKGHRSCLVACASDWTHVNFNGTTFRNGDPIPQIEDATDWANATGPAWCYYDNDPANGDTYGKLYNWHAVNDPRGLAPEGYHIPSLEEWNYIITCLGGINIAGGRMKVQGSNESMFSARLGGVRSSAGGFTLMNSRGSFWTSTDGNSPPVINFNVGANNIYIGPDGKTAGYSIRLIQGDLPTPPSSYRGRVLSLDAVPYDRDPNQIVFDSAGVPTVDGVYVYTQTGAPISGSMFHNTGFYGPVVSGKNNLVEFDVQYGKTGYFVGDWIENDWTYFNTGNIPFVNRVEIQGGNLNVNATYTRANSGDNAFFSDNGRRIIKNQNSGWDLQDDDNNTIYTNDDINLDPNGWYYNYINTIIISDAGTASSNGTYTRASALATFNGPNGNYIYNLGGAEWALFDTQLYNPNNEDYGYDSYYTEDFAGWYIAGANLGQNPAPNGLTTTAKYYLASQTDGLLGVQYSGYFDGDPTWFNTASVKPIINELTLAGASEGTIGGTYTRVGDENNQGTNYFQGPNGWMISYYSQFPAAESYWFLHPGDYNQYYTSNDLITWTQGQEGDTPPTATITQTQNFENSTNFGTTRALSNNTSWQWVGYFRANDTSNHNFYIGADEDAYFWIGDKAFNGYTTGNADMYSIANNSTNITNLPLTSGVYYPVRLQWGHPANPTFAGLSLSYRNGIQGNTYDFSGLFFNFTGNAIATNSNGHVYDFTLGEWQSTQTGYNPVPQVAYSHVWLDSISGFNNSGVMYTGNKHVTLVNNPIYSSDYSGIYSFNGVDQYALTQEVLQSADGSISYFVWFKPTGAGVVVDELGQPGLEGTWHDTQLEVMQDGKVNFGIWGDYRQHAEFKIQSTGSIDFDRWYHLGLTYSSGVLSAYIDGEKIADSNCQRMNGPASLYYAICGGDSTNMGEGGFGKGSVGSFQVYNKGLTEIQVGNLYSGEKDRFPNIDNMFFPSLWLDASTGVNKFDYNYISQIVLSGNPSVTGTYNASSIPTYNFEDERLNDYSLGNISYSNNGDGYAYRIITENVDGTDIGYESYNNGVNWSAFNSYTSQLIITGFTGAYTNANGTYNVNNLVLSDLSYSNGPYQLYGNNLESIYGDYLVVATKNNDGSFTPTNYTNKVTISNAGLTSLNGVYTRTTENQNTFVDSNNLPKISRDGNYWVLGGSYASQDLINWTQWEDEAILPLPNAVIETAPKLMGDGRISSTVSSPNGSVTGTITTSNVATDYVASWNDQSNNARDVARESEGFASLITIADKKFINFPANTTLSRQSFFNGYTGTVFVVARFDSSSAGSHANLFSNEDGFALSRGVDSSNAFYLENVNSDFSENIRTLSNTYANDNTNYIIGATFENNTASLYLNGAEAGNGSIGNLGVGYNLFIGGSSVGMSGPSDEPSNIAEVIAYNRVLNTSERQEVENYLSNKYSITLTPPAPAGIPVASTASVVIENAGSENNGTYIKKIPQQLLIQNGGNSVYINIAGTCYLFGNPYGDGRILFSPNAEAWDDINNGSAQFGTPFGNWKLGYVYYEGGDISSWFFDEIATNPSTDSSVIPVNGWSPAVAITAA